MVFFIAAESPMSGWLSVCSLSCACCRRACGRSPTPIQSLLAVASAWAQLRLWSITKIVKAASLGRSTFALPLCQDIDRPTDRQDRCPRLGIRLLVLGRSSVLLLESHDPQITQPANPRLWNLWAPAQPILLLFLFYYLYPSLDTSKDCHRNQIRLCWHFAA